MRTYAAIPALALVLAACGGRVQGDAPSNDAPLVPSPPKDDAGPEPDGGPTTTSGADAGPGEGVSCVPTSDGVCPIEGARHAFTSTGDVLARLQGVWLTCTGFIYAPSDAVGVDFSGTKARFLVRDASGAFVPGSGAAYERTVTVIDTSVMNGPGSYQMNLTLADGSFDTYQVSSYDAPSKLRLDEGTSGNEAQYAPAGESLCNAPVDAGPSCGGSDAGPAPGDGGACSIVGTWDVTANTPFGTDASFQFDADGTFTGGHQGADLPSQAIYTGQWSVDASGELVIGPTTGFLCNAYQTNLSLSFGAGCDTASLQVQTDGCTGGREHLDDTTTLTRR